MLHNNINAEYEGSLLRETTLVVSGLGFSAAECHCQGILSALNDRRWDELEELLWCCFPNEDWERNVGHLRKDDVRAPLIDMEIRRLALNG